MTSEFASKTANVPIAANGTIDGGVVIFSGNGAPEGEVTATGTTRSGDTLRAIYRGK